MNRLYMINELKKILPYNNSWFNKLSDKQVYAIYVKYIINKIPLPFEKQKTEEKWYLEKAEEILSDYYIQDIDEQYEFLMDLCEYENIDYNKLYNAIQQLPKPKILCKRRIYNGNKQVLADNGHWEGEID